MQYLTQGFFYYYSRNSKIFLSKSKKQDNFDSYPHATVDIKAVRRYNMLNNNSDGGFHEFCQKRTDRKGLVERSNANPRAELVLSEISAK